MALMFSLFSSLRFHLISHQQQLSHCIPSLLTLFLAPQCKLSTSVVGSTAFGVDISLDSETPPLPIATPAQLDAEALEPGAPLLGQRIQRAFETILATTRPSKSGVWLPLILMAHPSFRDPVRILANVSEGRE